MFVKLYQIYKKNNFIIHSYLILKLFFVLLAYITNSYFLGNENFFYGDAYEYFDENACNIFSFNVMYTMLSCYLGIDNISEIRAITFASFVSTIRDILYIFLAYNILSKKGLYLFAFLLSAHPYLAVYHPRFVTGLFASITFLYIFWIINSKKEINYFDSIFFILLISFRNALMPLIISFYVLESICSYNRMTFKKFFMTFVTILLSFLVTRTHMMNPIAGDYMALFFSDYQYQFSWLNIINYFSLEQNLISYIVTFPAVFISHLIFLLGFREAAYVDGIQYLFNWNIRSVFELVIYLVMLIVHALGLACFFAYFVRIDLRYLCFIFYFFPSMLFVAHMRYFFPMIPLSLLGLILILDIILFKKNIINKFKNEI